MLTLPLLLPVQESLLIDLIEADTAVLPNKRMHFIAHHWQSSEEETAVLVHPGLKGGNKNIFFGDLTVLAHSDLIQLLQHGAKSYTITILPEAYLHYGIIRQPTSSEARTVVRGAFEQALARAARALHVLELKAAGYGNIGTPVHITLDLEDKQAEVAELKLHLSRLSEDSKGGIS